MKATVFHLFFLLAGVLFPGLLQAQQTDVQVRADSLPDDGRGRTGLSEMSRTVKVAAEDAAEEMVNVAAGDAPGYGWWSPTAGRLRTADSLCRFSGEGMPVIPYYTDPSPMFRGDYRTGGVLFAAPGSVLYASGEQYTLPGIGRFNEASFGYGQQLHPRLLFRLDVSTTKVNMTHAVGQAFVTSGRLTYLLSDRVALNTFGAYAPGLTYGIYTHLYGGSVSFDVTDRFGMEVGVQRYYNSLRGWETVPMVIPSYRFDRFKLEMDVGGMLYQILRSSVFGKRERGGPTIAPPRFR